MLDKYLDDYINYLYFNQNVGLDNYLQNLYTKADYYRLLKPVVELYKKDSLTLDEIYNKLYDMANIEEIIKKFIYINKTAPGFVINYGTDNYNERIVVGDKQEVMLDKFGLTNYKREKMVDTPIFDLASVTKIFMTFSIIKLMQNYLINLEDEVVKYASQFSNLKGVAIFDLLTFGIPVKTDKRIDMASSREEAEKLLFKVVPEWYSNTTDPYSDIGVMVLRYVVEAVSGVPYYQFLKDNILKKYGMNDTMVLVDNDKLNRIAVTNFDGKIYNNGEFVISSEPKLGEVYDKKARIMGQSEGLLAGHAGLFSTDIDMVKLAKEIINGKVIDKEYVYMMAKNRTGRKYNFDGKTMYVQHYGFLCFTRNPLKEKSFVNYALSSRSFASIGWTGSQLVIDPVNRLYLFAAGNRTHNRLSFIDSEYQDKVVVNNDGTKSLILPNGIEMIDSTRFSFDRNTRVVNPVMELLMQYKMAEDIYKLYDKEIEKKVKVRHL